MAVWFTNLTLAATSYNWAFGDGTTLTTTDTTALEHFYTSAGQYSVCLTAMGPAAHDRLQQQFHLGNQSAAQCRRLG